MAVVVAGLDRLWPTERPLLGGVLFLGISLAAGVAAYATTTFMLGGREIPALLGLFRAPLSEPANGGETAAR
jgi:hypothetical protein